MKKFLSLVLALVMTMSLVTISAGAKDFDDNGDIDYKEAVDVISALGIVDGYSDGSFRPDGSLTRGAAAKIICNLILGPTTASALSASTAPFKDVPTTNVFAGYITYCAQRGIISGYGDGTFRPTGSLTGNAFLKMLLGALGYDSSIEGYTGANWQVNVIKQAVGIGLDDGNDDFVGSNTVTRQEACLYAFNMLQATMVKYDQKSTIVVGGVEINTTSTREDETFASVGAGADGNIDRDGKVQFAERYFTDLQKRGDTDSFDRPATTWRYDGSSVGTYTDAADETYTAKVEIGEIYRDLGLSNTIPASDVTILEDGAAYTESGNEVSYAIARNDGKKFGDNGVLTEVFYDEDADTVVISMIHYYAGEITATRAASGTRDAYVTVAPKRTASGGGTGNFDTNESFDVDDLVVYTYSKKSGDVGVQSVELAETVTGTLTGYTAGSSVTVGGTRYSANATNKEQITSTELGMAQSYDVTLMLDPYGYTLFVDTENATKNYAVVLSITPSGGDFNTDNRARLLLTDGTTVNVDVKVRSGSTVPSSLDNTYDAPSTVGEINKGDIVRYTVNNKGEYTLELLADVNNNAAAGNGTTATTIVTNGTSQLAQLNANKFTGSNTWQIPYTTPVYANGETIFLVASQGTDGTIYTVYTGIKNVPTLLSSTTTAQTPVTVFCNAGQVASVVFVDLAAGNGSYYSNSKDVIILLATSDSSTSYSTTEGTYYLYDAIVNGEYVEDFRVSNANAISTNGTYPMFTNATYTDYDGVRVATLSGNAGVVSSGDASLGVPDKGVNEAAKSGVVRLDGTYRAYADDVQVFVVNEDGDLTSETPLGISAVVTSNDNAVRYKVTDGEVSTILVIEPAKASSTPIGPVGFDLTGVTLTAGSPSSTTPVTVQLAGTGTIPAGYDVIVELVKTSKVDDDATVATLTYTEPVGGAVNAFKFDGTQSQFNKLVVAETGTYIAKVTVRDTAGRVVDTADSGSSVRVTVSGS